MLRVTTQGIITARAEYNEPRGVKVLVRIMATHSEVHALNSQPQVLALACAIMVLALVQPTLPTSTSLANRQACS